MLSEQIRKTVSRPGGPNQRHIADHKPILPHRYRIAQQVAVLVLPLIAVVIAQKLQGVPGEKLRLALRACLKSIKTPSRHIFFRWAALT